MDDIRKRVFIKNLEILKSLTSSSHDSYRVFYLQQETMCRCNIQNNSDRSWEKSSGSSPNATKFNDCLGNISGKLLKGKEIQAVLSIIPLASHWRNRSYEKITSTGKFCNFWEKTILQDICKIASLRFCD